MMCRYRIIFSLDFFFYSVRVRGRFPRLVGLARSLTDEVFFTIVLSSIGSSIAPQHATVDGFWKYDVAEALVNEKYN